MLSVDKTTGWIYKLYFLPGFIDKINQLFIRLKNLIKEKYSIWTSFLVLWLVYSMKLFFQTSCKHKWFYMILYLLEITMSQQLYATNVKVY